MAGAGSFARRVLGRTGIEVLQLGLPASYQITTEAFEHAIERGVNYVSWGWIRDEGSFRDHFVAAFRSNARRRDGLMIAASIVASASMQPSYPVPALDAVLRNLRTDHIDVLLVSIDVALRSREAVATSRAAREFARAEKLKEDGLIRFIGVVDEPKFVAGQYGAGDIPEVLGSLAAAPEFDVFHADYDASRPQLESSFLSRLPERPPGIVATHAATRRFLDACARAAKGEPAPSWEDCYRFALSHDAVDVCMCGAATPAQLDRALGALDRGPMTDDELARLRRIGAAVAQLD